MKRNHLLVCGVALVSALYLAPPVHASAPVRTGKGNCAMVFQFQGLSNLGVASYKGGIGIRHYLNEDTAIRPMLKVGLNTDKDKAVSDTDNELKQTNTDFGAEITIEKHLTMPVPSVSPYMGGQVGVNYSKTKNTLTPPSGSASETSQTAIDFGAGVVAGFEWGFSEGMTLGGEYLFGASVGSGNMKNTAGDKTSDMSRFTLGNGTASVFLSVAWK